MAIKTIYIARHGYRSNWLPQGPYPPPPTGVNSDVPLAEHGVKQAKELAHYIMSIDNQPELLFSSPFYRCLETSQPIADLLELPIYVERGIGEWYKPDRDVIPEPASFAVLNNFFPGKLSPDWDATVIPSDKGETEQDIFNRCREFLPKFVARVESEFPDVETILLVTHAATKIALGMNLLGFDNCREPLDADGTILRSGSCSLDKFELIAGGDKIEDLQKVPFASRKWHLTMNGNTEFLSNGEEMHWDFQYGFEAGSDADIRARKLMAEKDAQNITDANAAALPNATRPVTDTDRYEHVYFSVDIPGKNAKRSSEIEPNATLQYSGLETNAPLVKIGENFYEGSWQKLVGTELVFPDAAAVKTESETNEDDESLPNENVDEGQERESSADGTEPKAEKIYRITDKLVLEQIRPL
ncbi:LAME_0H12970g1_1 [Lachancea meyersii CBS 8951]|uniref:LAME_0H12970g1_1 n=1 Tax=Lachancea meyersii CBS 8951 TaxID=1266667 RepID=A0A1G4KH58_9SACH|nr:LAME_0H12970g1_1 [Lachancea meyersii CBS 8951]